MALILPIYSPVVNLTNTLSNVHFLLTCCQRIGYWGVFLVSLYLKVLITNL